METLVYRYQGHYCGDPAVYRPKSYLEEGKAKDAVLTFRRFMLEQNTATEEELDAIDKAMTEEILAAYEFAKSSPWPNPEEVIDNMFTSDNERSVLR